MSNWLVGSYPDANQISETVLNPVLGSQDEAVDMETFLALQCVTSVEDLIISLAIVKLLL